MSTIDKFRDAFGSIDTTRSVHHNVARLDAARAILKSEHWPPNVVSIAETRARRRQDRNGFRGDDQGKRLQA
jgi:hypothetical protein